jgi:hypothetical protein
MSGCWFFSRRFDRRIVLSVAILAVPVWGCSSKPAISGKRVTGTVTYNGAPVEGASVSFISPTASAYGSTDKEGHFSLRSSQGEGIPVGDYKVTVVKTDAPPPAEQTTYVPPDPNVPPTPPKDLLPAKYKQPETSQLSASVTDSGPNEFTFTLTD